MVVLYAVPLQSLQVVIILPKPRHDMQVTLREPVLAVPVSLYPIPLHPPQDVSVRPVAQHRI